MNIGAWPQWFPVDRHHFSDLNAELDDADDLRQPPAVAAVQNRNRKCLGFAVGTDPDGGLIDQIQNGRGSLTGLERGAFSSAVATF
jgi:hypothetical protein